jgi:hypothetical protein
MFEGREHRRNEEGREAGRGKDKQTQPGGGRSVGSTSEPSRGHTVTQTGTECKTEPGATGSLQTRPVVAPVLLEVGGLRSHLQGQHHGGIPRR